MNIFTHIRGLIRVLILTASILKSNLNSVTAGTKIQMNSDSFTRSHLFLTARRPKLSSRLVSLRVRSRILPFGSWLGHVIVLNRRLYVSQATGPSLCSLCRASRDPFWTEGRVRAVDAVRRPSASASTAPCERRRGTKTEQNSEFRKASTTKRWRRKKKRTRTSWTSHPCVGDSSGPHGADKDFKKRFVCLFGAVLSPVSRVLENVTIFTNKVFENISIWTKWGFELGFFFPSW